MPIAMPTGIVSENITTMTTALNTSVWSMLMRRAWRPRSLAAAGLPSEPSELRRTVELSFRAASFMSVGLSGCMLRCALGRAKLPAVKTKPFAMTVPRPMPSSS
eukprot:365098-Chlamydomonas_euryale.AAC.7